MTKLLPCPFCGGVGIPLAAPGNRMWVRCNGCAMHSAEHQTGDGARAVWNRRTDPARDALVAAATRFIVGASHHDDCALDLRCVSPCTCGLHDIVDALAAAEKP
jgi:hypothetical protein